jgi:hypothetical protein
MVQAPIIAFLASDDALQATGQILDYGGNAGCVAFAELYYHAALPVSLFRMP